MAAMHPPGTDLNMTRACYFWNFLGHRPEKRVTNHLLAAAFEFLAPLILIMSSFWICRVSSAISFGENATARCKSHPCLTFGVICLVGLLFSPAGAQSQTSVYECGTLEGGHAISVPRTVVCTPPKLESLARAVTANILREKTSLTEGLYRRFVRKRNVCTNTVFFESHRIANHTTEQLGFENKTLKMMLETNNVEQHSGTNCTLLLGYEWADTDTWCNTISTLDASNDASSRTDLNLGQYQITEQKYVTLTTGAVIFCNHRWKRKKPS